MARDLKLQVLLNAVDRATGPLKKITNASGKTAKALKADREQLGQLKRAQKDLGSFKQLKRQSETTASALHEQQRRVAQLTKEREQATGSTKRLTQQRNAAIRSARKLKKQYGAEQRELHGLRGKLKQVGGLTGSLSNQEKQLADRIKRTNNRINRQQKALKKLGQANVGSKFNNMTGEVTRFGRKAMFAIGGASAAIFGLSNSTANLGDKLDKQSKALGASTQFIQELEYAAEASGLSVKQMDSSLERYTRRLDRAAKGKGAAKDTYAALGLDPEALMKMDPAKQFDQIADALAGVDDQQKRLSLTTELFGRRAAKMVNIFGGGAEGLRELRKQAHETGYVLGNEAVANSDAFKTSQLRAQLALAGVKNTIGAELMPVVTDMMQELTKWLTTNHDKVVGFAKSFGDNLKAAVPTVLAITKGIGRMVKTMAHATTTVAHMVGGFDNLGMILAAVFAGKAIASVLSFGGAIFKAGSALLSLSGALPAVATGIKAVTLALAANPIGLIITAAVAVIAGAAFLIYKYWEPISTFFVKLWDTITGLFSDSIEAITKWLKKWGALKAVQKTWQAVADFFPKLWRNVTRYFRRGMRGIGRLLQRWNPLRAIRYAWSRLIDWFRGLWQDVKAVFSRGIDIIKNLLLNWTAPGLIYKHWDAITDWFGQLWAGIKDAFGRGIDATKDLLINWTAPGLIYKHWDAIADWFGERWSDIKAAFADGIGGVAKLLIDWSPVGLIYKGISAGLEQLGIDLPAKLSDVIGQALHTLLVTIPKQFVKLGEAIVHGIITGIGNMGAALKNSITGLAGDIGGWFKDKLGIQSPSRVFAGYGEHTVEGYRLGVARQEVRATDQVKRLAKRVAAAGAGIALGAATLPAAAALANPGALQAPTLSMPNLPALSVAAPDMPALKAPKLPRLSVEPINLANIRFDNRPPVATHTHRGGGITTGDININVQPAPGMDERALAQYVASEVQRALADAERDRTATRRSALYDTE